MGIFAKGRGEMIPSDKHFWLKTSDVPFFELHPTWAREAKMLFVRSLIVKRFSFDMILSSVSTWTTSGFAMVYHRRVAAHNVHPRFFSDTH